MERTNCTILITLATSIVGREIVRGLNDLGKKSMSVRVLVPDESKAKEMFKKYTNLDIQYCEGDVTDMSTVKKELFENVERLFLITPSRPTQPIIERQFVDMAIQQGGHLRHIVKLSILGATVNGGLNDMTKWQGDSEMMVTDLVRKTGYDIGKVGKVSLTILRPNIFLQNMLHLDRDIIKKEAVWYRPKNDGGFNTYVSHVDVRDVGDAASIILTEDIEKHRYQTYVLTGNSSCTYQELSEEMNKIIGGSVQLKLVDEEQFYRFLRKQASKSDLASWKWTKLFQMLKENNATANVHGDFKVVTGRDPRTAKQFFQDYKQEFN